MNAVYFWKSIVAGELTFIILVLIKIFLNWRKKRKAQCKRRVFIQNSYNPNYITRSYQKCNWRGQWKDDIVYWLNRDMLRSENNPFIFICDGVVKIP